MKTIVFTLHKRPFYTRPVLEAWRKVRGVEDWDVVFHIDPLDPSKVAAQPQESVQEAICRDFMLWHLGVSGRSGAVTIRTWNVHAGVLMAPWRALNEAFGDGAEYVVLAEEDVVPGNDALEYIEWAQYQANIACAWSDTDGPEDEAEIRKFFCPWLWGTDRATWYGLLRNTWDTDYTSADERGPGGWDCNIGLRLVHDRTLSVVFPMASRSQNIGKHLGAHSVPSEYGALELPESFKAERATTDWHLTYDRRSSAPEARAEEEKGSGTSHQAVSEGAKP